MVPGLRDNMDELVERLGRLVRALESKEFGSSGTEINVSRTVNVDEDTTQNTSQYFSTGAGRLAVENTGTWEDVPFGFVAEVINIRTTDDIEVAFANPNDSTGTAITIRSEESPFSIGGSYGIGTAFLWVRQAESATDTPAIEIIAYR